MREGKEKTLAQYNCCNFTRFLHSQYCHVLFNLNTFKSLADEGYRSLEPYSNIQWKKKIIQFLSTITSC